MSDVRPFEEYKEMIKDMRKEEMIKGLYDLSARVTKQENIIKEVREILRKYICNPSGLKDGWHIDCWNDEAISKLNEDLGILDKENK